MRTLIVSLVLILVCVTAFTYDFTITISDEKIAEFKEGVLAARPVPQDMFGNQTMTDKQWIEELTKKYFRSLYIRGKKNLAVFDENITE